MSFNSEIVKITGRNHDKIISVRYVPGLNDDRISAGYNPARKVLIRNVAKKAPSSHGFVQMLSINWSLVSAVQRP